MKKILFTLLLISLTSLGQESKLNNSESIYKITTKDGDVFKTKMYRINDKKKVIDIQKENGKFIRLKSNLILNISEVEKLDYSKEVNRQNISILFEGLNDSITNLSFNDKSITAIVKVEGRNKSKIYSLINKWVSLNYNSAKDVIQMNDKDEGIMILKGFNTVSYINPNRAIHPKVKFYPINSNLLLSHTLEVNVKDDKYRLVYQITDIIESNPKNSMNLNPFSLSCINFKKANDEDIANFNKFWNEKYFNDSRMSKKKKTKYLSLSKPTFEYINYKLVLSFVKNMTSISNSINNVTDLDDW